MVTSARDHLLGITSALDHLERDRVAKTRVLIFEISVVLKFLISEKSKIA